MSYGFFKEPSPEARIKMNEAFGIPFGPQEPIGWHKCKRCGMGVVGSDRAGARWQEHHECPEPLPYELAESLAYSLSYSGVPVSQTMKARIKLGLERNAR